METPRRMSLFYTCLSSSRCLPSNPGALTDRVTLLGDNGPCLKRPVVGEISSSRHQHMKELRVTAAGALRVLFAFDPRRNAILLIGGDKSGQWQQ